MRDSALYAVKNLNQQRDTAGYDRLQLKEDPNVGNVLLGRGILFNLMLELVDGSRFAFDFVQPLSFFPGWTNYLPDSADHIPLDVTLFSSPRLPSIELTGPVALYFPEPREDIQLKIPHWVKLSDSISTVKIHQGLKLWVEGVSSVRLVEDLPIQLHPNGRTLSLKWFKVPRLELQGSNIHFFTSQDTKVKAGRPHEIEISNKTGSHQYIFGMREIGSLDISALPQLLQNIDWIFGQSRALSDSPHTSQVSKIIAGTAEAVSLIMLPLTLETSHKVVSDWQVLLARNAEGAHKLLSAEELPAGTAISISDSILLNGTVYDVMLALPAQLENHLTM